MVTLPTGLPGGRHSEGTGFAEGLEPLQDKQSPGIQPIQCERFRPDFDQDRLALVKTVGLSAPSRGLPIWLCSHHSSTGVRVVSDNRTRLWLV